MAILVLDSTTKSVVVAMSGAAATTNPDFTASYADDTGTAFTEGANDGALNGTNSVTLVAAPAAATRRVIKSLTIENKDTAAVTITVSYNNNSTLRTIAKATLQVGDTWTTDGTFDTNGNLKTVIGAVNLTSQVSGILPVANGGTGLASGTSGGVLAYTATGTLASSGALAANAIVVGGGAGVAPSTITTGTGVVTALGVNTGSSGAFVVNGGALGTPTSGALTNCTADGTNSVGYRNVPQSGVDKTAAYTLAAGDVGKFLGIGTSGAITVPNGIFATGDVVSIFNNTASNSTLTMSVTTAYISGTNTDKDTLTLATRGLATVLFLSNSVCVVTGSVT